MKTFLASFLVFVSNLLIAGQSHAVMGGDSSGGGRGVYCQGPNGATTYSLDLYESKIVWGTQVAEFPGMSVTQVLSVIGDKLDRIQANYIEPSPEYTEQLLRVREILQPLPSDVHLDKINDSHDFLLPEHCSIVQIAKWVNEKRVLVDDFYFRTMGAVDQAALITHELIYYQDRVRNEAQDSVKARRFVGMLFSPAEVAGLTSGVPADALHCYGGISGQTPQFDFYLYQKADCSSTDPECGLVANMVDMDDKRMWGKTTFSLMGFGELACFEDRKNCSVSYGNGSTPIQDIFEVYPWSYIQWELNIYESKWNEQPKFSLSVLNSGRPATAIYCERLRNKY